MPVFSGHDVETESIPDASSIAVPLLPGTDGSMFPGDSAAGADRAGSLRTASAATERFGHSLLHNVEVPADPPLVTTEYTIRRRDAVTSTRRTWPPAPAPPTQSFRSDAGRGVPVAVVELAAAIEFSTSREKYVFVSPSPAASWLRARDASWVRPATNAQPASGAIVSPTRATTTSTSSSDAPVCSRRSPPARRLRVAVMCG